MGIKNNEAALQNTILEWLKYHPGLGYFYRTNNTPIYDRERKVFRAMPKYAPKGVPDISGLLCCMGGKACYFEVKQPKRYLSPHQKAFKAVVEVNGGICETVRSVEDVEKVFCNLLGISANELGRFQKVRS